MHSICMQSGLFVCLTVYFSFHSRGSLGRDVQNVSTHRKRRIETNERCHIVSFFFEEQASEFLLILTYAFQIVDESQME